MFFAHFFWFASVWARIGRASQLPWRRSATCKRRPNKGGPCHAAPTAENHATGGSVSQIKAEPVTLQLPPRRSATCKRRPNKGGPCHVAPTVEKTRREHKSGTSRPSQAERTTAPRQRPTAPRQRPDSAQTAPRQRPEAPSVPAGVLRTRPAGVHRKGRRAEGTHGRAARLYQMMIVAV